MNIYIPIFFIGVFYSSCIFAESTNEIKDNKFNNAPGGIQHIGDNYDYHKTIVNIIHSSSSSIDKRKAPKKPYKPGSPYKGQVIYKDGSEYNGILLNGKRHGNGLFKSVDGFEYDGVWKDDKRNGQGKETKISGAKYVGNWENDKRNGDGIQLYSDGAQLNGCKYDGKWKDDWRTGFGIFSCPSGYEQKGEWKGYDSMRGIIKLDNGDIFFGCLKKSEYFDGVYISANGLTCYRFVGGKKATSMNCNNIPSDSEQACPLWSSE